jgi:hypothetical protein
MESRTGDGPAGASAGVWVALAAILVQAPRLVLALLAADRQPVGASAERALLIVAGVGTALVLTGGNLYLAHTIAWVRRWRSALVAAWLAVLVSTGGLVVPLVAAGLSGRTLPQVLGGERLAWSWSLLAALAHEVTAAGCVLAAAAAASERRLAAGSHEREIEELLRQRDVARQELAALRTERGVSRPADRRSAAESSEHERSNGAQPERRSTSPQAEPPGRAQRAGRRRLAQRTARQSAARRGAEQLVAPLACPEGCGRSFPSTPALSGHLRHCSAREERLRRLAASL